MCFLVVFMLVFLLTLSQAQKLPAKSECLNSFNTHRRRFDVCLTNECIIFRDELPFVFLDRSMRNPEQEVPFPCIRHKAFYPKLRGAFFDTIRDIPTLYDSYCVWAGPDCSFDGELDFLKATAVGNPTNTNNATYQFIVGGLLFVLADRLTLNTIPSAALLEDKLHVLGPPREDTASPGEAWNLIWRPFTDESWYFIFSCVFGHALARIWISYHFSVNSSAGFSWGQFRARLFGHYYSDVTLEDGNEENWKHMDSMWVLIAKLFIGIILILWEVAIAVKVFERTNVGVITKFEPEKFAITKGSTMERIFSELMDRTESKESWKRLGNIKEVYQALEDPNDIAQYTLSYEIVNRHKMNADPEVCNTLRLYHKFPEKSVPSQKPPSFTGVWFYSSNINATRRLEIDTAIVNLKAEGKIEQIVDFHAGGEIPDICLSKQNSIEWSLIALLLVVLPGFPFFLFVCNMIWCSFRARYKTRSNDDDAKDDEEFSQPNSSSTGTTPTSSRSGLSHFRNLYPW